MKKYRASISAKDKNAYWRLRPRLLKQFKGSWIAMCGGKVVAHARDMIALVTQVYATGVTRPFFITLVGNEDKAVARVRRRTSFPYDGAYAPPLPRVAVRFTDLQGRRAARYQATLTPFYPAIAEVAGRRFPILLEAEPTWTERLLGRDVLNGLVATFDGPRRRTTLA